MNFGKTKILIAMSDVKRFREILPRIKGKYDILSSFDVNTTLQKVFNDNVSLIVLDKKLDILSVGTQTIREFLSTIHESKRIPIIMMSEKWSKMVFDDFGFGFNKYGLDELDEHIESILLQNTNYYFKNEDVQNFIASLVLALESKDEYSKNHSARVAKYASMIAEEIGESTEFKSTITLAGLFHDIGKIGIPDSVLLKPGKLTNAEYRIIMEHPEKSEEICFPIQSFQRLLPIIRGHHERFDGKGYPDGLKGTEIPIEARIIAVADTFDALTSNRAYRKALDISDVLEILEDGAGKQWDKDVIALFVNGFDSKKTYYALKQENRMGFMKGEDLVHGTIFENLKN